MHKQRERHERTHTHTHKIEGTRNEKVQAVAEAAVETANPAVAEAAVETANPAAEAAVATAEEASPASEPMYVPFCGNPSSSK